MSAVFPIEKRACERLPAPGLSLRLFIKGQRIKSLFRVLDFNRNGIAFTSETLLTSSQKLRLLLRLDNRQVGPVEAAVHNCRLLKSGEYRCGLQFRTDSPDQLDRQKVNLDLQLLEDTLRIKAEL